MGLKGKSFSLPLGMVFKKHYCSKCGCKLKKEKTHRIVTKEDKDYYCYHKADNFPQGDYDVYDYRFMCPSCQARISYDEQCIINKIQKKNRKRVLSSYEIKNDYEECKKRRAKGLLMNKIIFSIAFVALFFTIYYFNSTEQTPKDLLTLLAVIAIFTVFIVVGAIKRHKGTYKMKIMRSYSYEKKALLNKLYAYSSHNKSLVDMSEKCYCFYCKGTFMRSEITKYTDNGETALCPKCNTASILPDSIDEAINENIISEMNEYWY